MQKLLQAKIKDLEFLAATPFEAVDAEQVAEDCRSTIDDIRAKAMRAGMPSVVRATQMPGGGINWAREVVAACIEALPPSPDSEIENGALDVTKVAAQLGVSRETVYGLCADGTMPHTRIGKRITITAEQLSEYRRSASR